MLRFVSFFALSLLAPLAPGVAEAQSPPKAIIVVDVPQGEPALDANRLRAAVASELDADAVTSDDPRALRASGTLRVSIDRAAHALMIAYQGHTQPIVRKVDLPGSAQATERAAVLLAGNLARDEAGELAAELRKSKATAQATPSASAAREANPEDEKVIRDLDALGVSLAHEIRAGRSRESAAGLLVGLGVGLWGAGSVWLLSELAAGSRSFNDGPWGLWGAGGLSMIGSAFLQPGDFSELNEYYARDRASRLPSATVREDVEQAWLRAARAEHRKRRRAGWVETVLGGLLVTSSATFLVIDSQQRPSSRTFPLAQSTAFGAIGASGLALGVVFVATDGPLESALHAYERGAGRVVTPTQTVSLVPFFAPASGGVVLGLGGRF